MYDFERKYNKPDYSENAKKEADRMLAKMISEVLLESDAPEEVKMSVRVIDAAQECHDTLRNILESIVGPNSEKLNIDNAKRFCLLLASINNQIKAFAYTSPLIASTAADNENI